MSRFDEFGLIDRYLAPLAIHPAAAGLRDDVAILATGSLLGDLALNADAIVAGVHFLPGEAPATVAERALRVNLSDLAAKGARPLGYLLTLALTAAEGEAWIADFAEGLAANQSAFGWSLLGGDTVRTPGPLTVGLTALGERASGGMGRGGAHAGDEVWVTGWIGDGALGLAVSLGQTPILDHELAAAARAKFRRPEPRVAFGVALGESGLASAAADVSDGLVADLDHIAVASGLGAAVEAGAVPFSAGGRAAMAADTTWLARLLTGGDDYEIVFTAPMSAAAAISRLGGETGTPVACIGSMTAGRAVRVYDDAGRPICFDRGGFRHF